MSEENTKDERELTPKDACSHLAPWIARQAARQLGVRNPDVDDLMQEMFVGILEAEGSRLVDYRHSARKAMWRFVRRRNRSLLRSKR